MNYTITIPISMNKWGKKWERMYPISWNEYERMHFIERNQMNKLWYSMVAMLNKKLKIPLLNKPTIQITYYFPTVNTRDWFNFCSKPISDSLVKAGIIEDDSDECVDIKKPIMKIDKENPRTAIELEAE